MFVPKKRNYRKRGARKTNRKSAGRKGGSVSVAVKRYVKSTISRDIENKRAISDNSFAVGTIANSNILYARPLTPAIGFMSISQGVGQGDRIGNMIKTKKVMLRYVLYPIPYDITVNPNPAPIEFQMIFGYVKTTPTTTPSVANVQQMYQLGNSATAPNGDLGDLINPFNTDVWVIKKVIKHKIGYAVAEGSGGRPNSQYFANNDFKLNVVRSLDITSIYPSKFTFQDTVNTPTNAGLFLMCQAINADGTTSAALNTKAFIEYAVDFTYEDA